MTSPMARVLRARYVTRLIEHLTVLTEASQKRKLTMPGCMLRQPKPTRQLRLSVGEDAF